MTRFDAPQPSLPQVWAQHARWHPDRTALVCGERRISWQAFNANMNRVANGLAASDLPPGSRVAVLMGNSAETVEIMFGAVKGGFVVVPLSGMLRPDTIATMIADSAAEALFVSPDLLPLVSQLPAASEPRIRICVGGSSPGYRSYAEFAAAAFQNEVERKLDPEQLFAIIYSSGTTGTPKGIVHPHRTRLHLAYAMAVELGITDRSVALASTALYANGTWLVLLPALFAGATLVIMEKFTPEDFLETVEREGVTHAFLVPPQFAAILGSPGLAQAELGSLTAMLSGGAPFPADVKRQTLERIGPGLHELYGCTEGIGTIIKPDRVVAKPTSVGRPLLGLDLRIIDSAGRPLPPGEAGEIVGYGPALMQSYHNRPDATEEAIWRDAGGRTWLRTGDIGRIDEDGDLTVLDRKKDMIVSGGFNIFAADIEQLAEAHPDVAEVAVIGVPDQRWGETPLALVVPPSGRQPDPLALAEWVNARLARHQRVCRVELRESFPRNALGKILKRELRYPFWPQP